MNISRSKVTSTDQKLDQQIKDISMDQRLVYQQIDRSKVCTIDYALNKKIES